MKRYRLVNNITGWLVFFIAAATYCLTVEPTASFWDCPEFITTGYKLEVGHPPGAPFFMLLANFFSNFASDASQVAYWVNTMNALLSAGCILFLFWSVTHLTRRLLCGDEADMNTWKMMTIMASGVVGALAYAWSDTFWFSAVEGEVYAFSSFFTAAVFWLILKWESVADEPHSDRYLVLIAYLMGLSIGVHLLNLLCIPAIVLVYYYKKNPKADVKGSLMALAGSGVIIAAILYGIIPGVVKMGGWFELLFVNKLGFSFNTGLIIYLLLLAASVAWGVYESYTVRSRKLMNISFLLALVMTGMPFYGYGVTALIAGIILISLIGLFLKVSAGKDYELSARSVNTAMLCVMMILIGYSSYALIVVRSMANTPMDQNSPEDIFTLGEYLGREQYGTRPLFYGETYASKPKIKEVAGGWTADIEQGAPVYGPREKASEEEKDRYDIIRYRQEYNYAQKMFFPRMWSSKHASLYESALGGIEGKMVPYEQYGEMTMVKVPTQWENFKFLVSYQMNYMYWRYFLWNFAGRQDDIQSDGSFEHGNWVTGIPFIDEALVGDNEFLPDSKKENKGHNVYYCLPLLLGLLGMFYQANTVRRVRRDGEEYLDPVGIRQFWVVLFLFFMTGLAIVLYLNQTPAQPRERDYAYAGSFYAFAIWIGLGTAGLAGLLRKWLGEKASAIAASALAILVPIQMVGQTWDDHDRSGRYTCRDFGSNYLNTLPEEGSPIIFTNGDNDTFPLWYNQEVEGCRTDARVCNLSYLQTDWYIDQMRRPAYDSPSLPIDWTRLQYVADVNEAVMVRPDMLGELEKFYTTHHDEAVKLFGENPYELGNILEHWVKNPISEDMHIIPTDSIVVPVDSAAIVRSGMMIPEEYKDNMPKYMTISLKGKRVVYKSELMMMELIDKCKWERPLYIAVTVGRENRLNLERNFIQEGLAYRITPFTFPEDTRTPVDVDKLYDNVMNRFKYGNISQPGLYLDETTYSMCETHRRLLVNLASSLIARGDKKRAKEVLDRAEKEIPGYNVRYSPIMSSSLEMADDYALCGSYDKAMRLYDNMANDAVQHIIWYMSLDDTKFYDSYEQLLRKFYLLDKLNAGMTLVVNDADKAKSKEADNYAETALNYAERFSQLYKEFNSRIGVQPKK